MQRLKGLLKTCSVHYAHSVCAFLLIAALALQCLYGCAGAPAKPSVDVGVIDCHEVDSHGDCVNGQVIENMSGGKSFNGIDAIDKAKAANITAAIKSGGRRVQLSSYDKAICFLPDWWNVEVDYIHSLETYLRDHCQAQ